MWTEKKATQSLAQLNFKYGPGSVGWSITWCTKRLLVQLLVRTHALVKGLDLWLGGGIQEAANQCF